MLLVQLPPSLAFEPTSAEAFFVALRQRFAGAVVLEPRHESWVAAAPMLQAYRIAQAMVDPSRISTDGSAQGWAVCVIGDCTVRHAFTTAPMTSVICKRWQSRCKVAAADAAVWCIFDNTASGAALQRVGTGSVDGGLKQADNYVVDVVAPMIVSG
jgi:uncharacterized protein YecE (DUF72 family)